MKKWLARAVVLAMIVAMMVPMPVAAAKSSGGGKLVASVTTYYPEDGGGWLIDSKVSFKYGKSNKPTEITTTGDYTTYLGVPVGGKSETITRKYTKKSMKSYDSAGFLTGKATLKGGKEVAWSWDNKSSFKVEKDGKYVDYANLSAGVGHYSYFKNGLLKASDGTYSGLNSDNESYAYTNNAVYSWTQKKGVPSLMYATYVSNGTGAGGIKYDGTPTTYYAIFNSKGLVIEEGRVVDGKNVADWATVYTMKKGKVDTAVTYEIEEGKPTPYSMMKFKYTKKSVSKTFYLTMMNDLLGAQGFNW